MRHPIFSLIELICHPALDIHTEITIAMSTPILYFAITDYSSVV